MGKLMKIFLTCDYPFIASGLSVLAQTAYEELKNMGHEITVHSLFDHNGIDKILQTQKFDVHLGVGYWANAKEQIQLPKKYGVKTATWWVSEANVPKHQDLVSQADALIVISNYSKRIFEQYVPDCKPIVVYPGCDIDFYKPRPQKPSRLFSTFVSSGEVKGCEEVLTSINYLKSKNLDFKYIIHSPHTEYKLEKDYMLRLKQIVQNNQLDKWVSLVGGVKMPLEKMPALYQTLYFYMCSMRMGCFGLPIIEAGACGIPTIAGDWEPMSESIIDGETGILVPYMAQAQFPKYMEGIWFTERYKLIDSEILANKIADLLQDETKRNRMGESARKHVEQNFNVHTQIKKLEQELLKIVN
jgi:glycosyltransferase involved in cell wall biosynthesis